MQDEIKQLISRLPREGYSQSAVGIAGTISIISSSAGLIRAAILGSNSCPTLTIYDNASGASGTVLALIEPGTKGTWEIWKPVSNGITCYLTGGNVPNAFISYR